MWVCGERLLLTGRRHDGAPSAATGFNQRVALELNKICPQGLKVKVATPRSTIE